MGGQFILTRAKLDLTNSQLESTQNALLDTQQQLQTKVGTDDYAHLKSEVYDQYCTLAALDELKTKVTAKASWEEVQHLRVQTENIYKIGVRNDEGLAALTKVVDELAAELDARLLEVNGQTEETKAKSLLTRVDLTARVDKVESTAQKTNTETMRQLHQFTRELTNFCTQAQLDEVREKADGFATTSSFEKLYNHVFPRVNDFQKYIATYKADNEDMKLCVRSFDEKLCQKANKMDVS